MTQSIKRLKARLCLPYTVTEDIALIIYIIPKYSCFAII